MGVVLDHSFWRVINNLVGFSAKITMTQFETFSVFLNSILILELARLNFITHCFPGKPCEFIVNTCNAGKGTLQVTVDGPSRVTMDCQEVEEGYSVSYVPYVPGEYVITIKYAGAYHINGSPFRASITG